MPYSIVTKDGIKINNIPDDIDPESPELKQRVTSLRAGGNAPPVSVLPSTKAQTDSLDEKLKAEGGGGILGFMGDIDRSAKNLKYATPLSEGGREGMKDALSNLVEGTMEAVGQGNRAGVKDERTRQARLEAEMPGYAQAKNFWNVAGNPVSYAPAGTIARAALSGGAIAGTQPAENATQQVSNALTGTLLGGALGAGAKVATPGVGVRQTAEEVADATSGLRDTAAVLSRVPSTTAAAIAGILRMAHGGAAALRRVNNWKTIENPSAYTAALIDRLRRIPGQSGGAWEDQGPPSE